MPEGDGRVNEGGNSRRDIAEQLRRVIEERNITSVFQPIFGFREGRMLGYEALVRGPEGSLIQTPFELFSAAHEQGLALELNVICVQEMLRAFARSGIDGNLFVNVSPQLIMQRGFERERAAQFLDSLGLQPERVVIELTEDYPTVDFPMVHETLMLYRAMGFRIAIDDLGEGFASLRLWSELKPEFVKADKHFVAGIANDAVKLQFLRAIQHIADNAGAQVIAEGIENADDFRVVKDIGIACGQGWFIGRPSEKPNRKLPAEAELAFADARVPVVTAPRLRAGTEPNAHEFVRAVEPAFPETPMSVLADRFEASPGLAAIPVVSESGIEGLVARSVVEMLGVSHDAQRASARPCIEYADRTPVRVEASLDLTALAAMLVETDSRHLAEGFVIVSRGRYVGMGSPQDVIRSLQSSRVLAARYTNPITMLPGQVPVHEHLERLLARHVPFTAWFIELDHMRGVNDCMGYERGDALIHATARLLESVCQPGVDFAGHIAGTRFVMLVQSEDWSVRAERLVRAFQGSLEAHVPADAMERGYFSAPSRDGRESVRPLPRLGVGILPVLPGVFETRHEVVSVARQAVHQALTQPGTSVHVDQRYGNAYPQSLLFDQA